MSINNDEELACAVDRMREAGTDLAEWELKSAAGGFPKTTTDTISAFANTNGGSIVFGITEKGFHSVDSFDVKEIQAKCAQAARELVVPAVPIDIEVLFYESRPVVVANIPELPTRKKPCYVKKLGQVDGTYIRAGDGDHKMSLYEIDRFIENQQRSARNDAVIVPEATMGDFDPKIMSEWLSLARSSSFGRMDSMDDATILANKRVVAVDDEGVVRPTVAGLLAMGSYPQKYFPRLDVVFTSYPGTSKGIPNQSGSRFTDAVNIDGPIPEMIVAAVKTVSRNMKHGAIVKGALREDVPDYPLPAVREAVANALMHRDYSAESQGTPVIVDLYPDRLEITNPGGLYGSLTVESLGTKGTTTSRNQFMSRVLEDVSFTDYDGSTGHVVENRGSGYPTITGELEKALMAKPIVLSSLDEFKIIFRHRSMTEQEGAGYSKSNVEEAIIDYFTKRESVSKSEIARAAGISPKTAMVYVNRLIDEGIVEGIGSRNSPKRRYRMS